MPSLAGRHRLAHRGVLGSLGPLERSWERATVIVAGSPELPHEPTTEVVADGVHADGTVSCRRWGLIVVHAPGGGPAEDTAGERRPASLLYYLRVLVRAGGVVAVFRDEAPEGGIERRR